MRGYICNFVKTNHHRPSSPNFPCKEPLQSDSGNASNDSILSELVAAAGRARSSRPLPWRLPASSPLSSVCRSRVGRCDGATAMATACGRSTFLPLFSFGRKKKVVRWRPRGFPPTQVTFGFLLLFSCLCLVVSWIDSKHDFSRLYFVFFDWCRLFDCQTVTLLIAVKFSFMLLLICAYILWDVFFGMLFWICYAIKFLGIAFCLLRL